MGISRIEVRVLYRRRLGRRTNALLLKHARHIPIRSGADGLCAVPNLMRDLPTTIGFLSPHGEAADIINDARPPFLRNDRYRERNAVKRLIAGNSQFALRFDRRRNSEETKIFLPPRSNFIL